MKGKDKGRCIAVKSDGTQCQARKQRNGKHCFFHDPEKNTARRKAGAAGGARGYEKQVAHLLKDSDTDWQLDSIADVKEAYRQIINAQLRGKLLNNAVAVLNQCLQGLLKTIQQGDIEDRLAVIEKKLGLEGK